MGDPATSSSRLNLVQAFNSMGTTFAPLFGAYLILGRSKSGTTEGGAANLTAAEKLADAQSVQLPYLIVAGVLVVIAVIIGRYKFPDIKAAISRASPADRQSHSLWRHRNLVFGVPAIAIYLIAEIGVGNLFVNFVSAPEIGNMTHEEAGRMLFLLWGGMMIGRFVGSFLMRSIRPETVLAVAASLAFVVLMITSLATGQLAMWAPDQRRSVPLDHVPDHLHAWHPRPWPADRGRFGSSDHGHRGRGIGDRAGLAGGYVRPAIVVPPVRRVRAICPVLRLVGCEADPRL
jgi:FHS family L-fucose permease-like MFS transporter